MKNILNILVIVILTFGVCSAQKKDAIQLLEKGKQLYNENKYNQAIHTLLKSQNKKPYSETSLYLGKCWMQIQDTCEGCKYFLEAINLGDNEETSNYYNKICFQSTKLHDTSASLKKQFPEYAYTIFDKHKCINLAYQKKYNSTGKMIDSVCMEMPEYYGGDIARNTFLAEQIIYPRAALESRIQGTVYVSFIVDASGKISDIKILKGIGGGCDDEVIRVVKLMPKWKPGTANGKPVRVLFKMPVYFKLQG